MSTLHDLSSEIITGNSDSVDLLIGPMGQSPATGLSAIIVQYDVTVVSGTNPLIDMMIEESIDGVNWFPFLVFSVRNAPGHQIMRKSDPAQFIRAKWTITGTSPSFTFALPYITRT